PHAFVLACLMDRQWPAEKCWLVPYRLKERLGSFEFNDLAVLPQDRVVSLFLQEPPLHRLKEIMARIFFAGIQRIRQRYSGKASLIWEGEPSSASVVRRFLEFDGVGQKI